MLSLCLGLLLCHTGHARVHEHRLANGLKVLIKEDHRAPVVVSQIWYKVGGSYEHAGITGVSHALEHMMFKGTTKYPANEFSRIISEQGGSENAFTGADYTAYFQILEHSRLEISLELEADRMQNLLLAAPDFEKELEVVKEERRLRTEDDPQSYTWEVAMATAFQTSPYRQPIIGWMNDLDNMRTHHLQQWYEQYYAPNNATLVIAGDVDPDETIRLVRKHFTPLPQAKATKSTAYTENAQRGSKRVRVKRAARVPWLAMLYKVPALSSKEFVGNPVAESEPYALAVLVGILDGGDSARFPSRLVRGQELAAQASASYSMLKRLPTVLSLTGTPAPGHTVLELELAIRQALLELQEELVDEKELQRVKAQVISAEVYEKDSVFYQALVLGLLETVNLSWKLTEEYVSRINAVTADDVRAVARRYLVDDGLTVAELEPLPTPHVEQTKPMKVSERAR